MIRCENGWNRWGESKCKSCLKYRSTGNKVYVLFQGHPPAGDFSAPSLSLSISSDTLLSPQNDENARVGFPSAE